MGKKYHQIPLVFSLCLSTFFAGCSNLQKAEENSAADASENLGQNEDESMQDPFVQTGLNQNNPSEAALNNSDADQNKTGSVFRLLKNGLRPMGSTLYVWGGGWNEDDTGGGAESVLLNPASSWKSYYDNQNADYDYMESVYQIHNGLDCSGYIGWSLYNTFETLENQESYVTISGNTGAFLSEKNFGTVIPAASITNYLPGDILFNEGHVFMVVCPFPDGSLLIMHSSPPGVSFSGTPDLSGNDASLAAEKAMELMQQYFPEYYARYGSETMDYSYLTDYDQFRWNEQTMPDLAVISKIKPEELLYALFRN